MLFTEEEYIKGECRRTGKDKPCKLYPKKVYGTPLQCSCLENPRDGGASRAAVYGVAQSRTWLKRLSSSSSSSVAKWCPTLWDSLDCSPPGSSARGIFQARILEWVAIPSPGDPPNLRIEPASSASPALVDRFCVTEPPGKPKKAYVYCIHY